MNCTTILSPKLAAEYSKVVKAPAAKMLQTVLLLPPAVEEFLNGPAANYAVCDADGKLLRGEAWLCVVR